MNRTVFIFEKSQTSSFFDACITAGSQLCDHCKEASGITGLKRMPITTALVGGSVVHMHISLIEMTFGAIIDTGFDLVLACSEVNLVMVFGQSDGFSMYFFFVHLFTKLLFDELFIFLESLNMSVMHFFVMQQLSVVFVNNCSAFFVIDLGQSVFNMCVTFVLVLEMIFQVTLENVVVGVSDFSEHPMFEL